MGPTRKDGRIVLGAAAFQCLPSSAELGGNRLDVAGSGAISTFVVPVPP